VWDTLKLTNRIVGPMCRVRASLRRINEGQEDWRPISFREGDFWREIADELNLVMQRLQEARDEASSKTTGHEQGQPEQAGV
jgi:hypothetical protein